MSFSLGSFRLKDHQGDVYRSNRERSECRVMPVHLAHTLIIPGTGIYAQ